MSGPYYPDEILDADGWAIPTQPQRWWREPWEQEKQKVATAGTGWGRAYHTANLGVVAMVIAAVWVISMLLKFVLAVVLALLVRGIIGLFLGDD